MILAVQYDTHHIITDYVNKLSSRLKGDNMFNNPFIDGKVYTNFSGNTTIISATPIYKNMSIIFLALGIVALFFKWYVLTMVNVFLFLLINMVWSKYFTYTVMYLKLRFLGYKGKIKIIQNNELINLLLKRNDFESVESGDDGTDRSI